MYNGDSQGNAYVGNVLTPAVAAHWVTLRSVPVADTSDALPRVLAERQAGLSNGSVDLVWSTGRASRPGSRPGHGCAAGRTAHPTPRSLTRWTRC